MPITNDNYQKAEDFIARAKMDPTFDPVRLSKIQSDLDNFKTSQQQSTPFRDPTEGASPATRGSVAGYFYKPSLDEFHQNVQNPEVQQSSGLADRYKPGTVQPVGDRPQSYQELLDPNTEVSGSSSYAIDPKNLGEDSPEYKAYTEYAYRKAKEQNPNVERYDDLQVSKNPFKKALGAVVKYGTSAALGAEKSVAIGIPRKAAQVIAGNTPDSAADTSYDPMGAPSGGEYHPEKADAVKSRVEQLDSLSPGASAAGNLGGYLLPIAPANAASSELINATGYAARSPLVKALIGGGIGSTVAAGEGAAQDFIDNPTMSAQEYLDRGVPRAFWGAALGAGSDLLAQGSAKGRQAFEESPRWSPIKNQKDIGGNTNVLTGIQTTPEVRANVRAANASRENKTAADIAAMKVAPKVREAKELELTNKATEINKQMEDYYKSPYGQEQQSAQPVVDRLLNYAEKGTFEMPVSGRTVSADRGSADAIRKHLQEFAEFQHVSPEEAQAMVQQRGGKVLSSKQADILGLPQEAGKVHVVVPGKFNAEALIKKEDQIARNLKYETREGGIDNPVLKELELGFKETRDQFKYDDPNGFTERRAPNRPTESQWQAMQNPSDASVNSSEFTEAGTSAPDANASIPEVNVSSVGPGNTSVLNREAINNKQTSMPEARKFSEPAPVAELRGNKRYQEPSASEYAKIQNGENVDKSGNGYQRLVDAEDFAPGYRMRASPNEVANLSKLAEDTTALESIQKANPGISDAEATQILNAQKRLSPEETDYNPEFPKDQSERRAWAAPYPGKGARGNLGPDSPVTPSRIGIGKHSDWTPNEDLYTANPPENISASEAQSIGPGVKSEQQQQSLFPDTPDQVGVPSKSELAKANQTPDVGEVKRIVDQTDKAAAGLTPDELDAVHSYTSRKGDKVGSKEWHSALDKLTVDKPTAGGPLYHGTRLPQEQIDKILKDKSISMDKPTSTSYNRDISSAMAHSRAQRGEPVIFKIPEVDNGVSLASRKLGIAGTNNEKEILLHSKEFEVVNSSKDSEGNLVIELKQKTKGPKQLSVTREDGTVVKGFSALRNKQSQDLEAIKEATKDTGAATQKGAHNRVLNYKNGEGSPYENAALAEEADRLGIRQQLEEVPATREYAGLRARAWGGGGEGPMNSLKDFMGFRLDPILSAIAGEGRNPYAPMPNTPAGRIREYLFQQGVPMRPLLEGRGGLWGARYGNEAADYQESKKRNNY